MLDSRKTRETNLIRKCWADEAYKKELFADPKAVIAREAGVNFPEGLEVEVVEEPAGKMIFVLPNQDDGGTTLEGELNDADLENVAGGKGDTNYNNCSIDQGGAAQNTQVNIL